MCHDIKSIVTRPEILPIETPFLIFNIHRVHYLPVLVVLSTEFASFFTFLCQLTQSADIISPLCGVGLRVHVNNFSYQKYKAQRHAVFF